MIEATLNTAVQFFNLQLASVWKQSCVLLQVSNSARVRWTLMLLPLHTLTVQCYTKQNARLLADVGFPALSPRNLESSLRTVLLVLVPTPTLEWHCQLFRTHYVQVWVREKSLTACRIALSHHIPLCSHSNTLSYT